MASLGISKFQDLIGRTDLLKVRDDLTSEKSKTLDLSMVLRNALELRPGVNIKGGSIKQDFQLEQRPDNVLIEKVMPVLNGEEKSINIEMTINNETRAFGSTLSYHISKYELFSITFSYLLFYYFIISFHVLLFNIVLCV
jgi:glutamate synthase (NADPH/NADH)